MIDVIHRKIETDVTGVTTPAGAIRHAVLTDSRGSDGCRNIRQEYHEKPNMVISSPQLAYFLSTIAAIRAISAVADEAPAAAVTR